MNSDLTLNEIARTLERIEQRLDGIVSDHEARLRSVERWVWSVPPTLIIALASIVAAIVS